MHSGVLVPHTFLGASAARMGTWFAPRDDIGVRTPREKSMTRITALLLLLGTVFLAACNTVAGAGQDISKGGNAITNSAEKHSD